MQQPNHLAQTLDLWLQAIISGKFQGYVGKTRKGRTVFHLKEIQS